MTSYKLFYKLFSIFKFWRRKRDCGMCAPARVMDLINFLQKAISEILVVDHIDDWLLVVKEALAVVGLLSEKSLAKNDARIAFVASNALKGPLASWAKDLDISIKSSWLKLRAKLTSRAKLLKLFTKKNTNISITISRR
eukprot:TRINITY_DN5519_c0_g1_i10.p1 TRINITY_DN5519_c0_g1~~TRINITY_DN5519_c0_g1_i10.p1  ORF type:complete len:139 (+),score=14.01 TRINITY_DN5519_c0_g1_i10:310-726(+)